VLVLINTVKDVSTILAERVGLASLPAKTTGTEAGPTHDVNESPTLSWQKNVRPHFRNGVLSNLLELIGMPCLPWTI
jgi:hypothetical protein